MVRGNRAGSSDEVEVEFAEIPSEPGPALLVDLSGYFVEGSQPQAGVLAAVVRGSHGGGHRRQHDQPSLATGKAGARTPRLGGWRCIRRTLRVRLR
jgi:hypothetical protein